MINLNIRVGKGIVMEKVRLKDLKTSMKGVVDPDTLLIPVEEQSRYGEGYKDFLYRVEGTEDLVRVRHSLGEEPGEDEVIIEKDYFKIRKAYSKRVGELSREFKIPYKVSLAIGDNRDNYVALKNAIADVDKIPISTLRDIHAGIARRKAGLKEILGDSLYDSLKIDEMGQKHSERIALYVWDRCMSRVNN